MPCCKREREPAESHAVSAEGDSPAEVDVGSAAGVTVGGPGVYVATG
jgi:hypothetical protein